MRCAVLYGIKDLKLATRETIEPGDGEVLVKIKAAAICGTDIRMWQNGAPNKHNIVMGHEVAGDIESFGAGVEGYQIGDKVAVAPNFGCGTCDLCVAGRGHMCAGLKALGINMDGGFSEYMIVPAKAVRQGNISRLKKGTSYEQATIVEALACVYNGFETCNISPGESVLIIGAGPIGMMHAMLANMAGASKIILHDISEQRLEFCKKTIGIKNIYHGNGLKQYIMEETNEKGVDVLITACPSPDAQAASIELMANYGRINFFGGLPKTKEKVELNTNTIHYKNLIVTGSTRSSLAQYRKSLALVEEGVLDISPLVTDRFDLKDIVPALEYAAAGKGIKSIIAFD